MKRPSDTPDYQPPTLKNLLAGTAASLAVASLVLVTVVMPAEYGLDPTGLGKAMGLTALAQATDPQEAVAPEPQPAAPAVATPGAEGAYETVQSQQGEFRTDSFEIPLAPGQGLEFKVILSAGETLLYDWDADQSPLYYDMHGEPLTGPDGFFLSYEEETGSAGQGALRAPFEGTHGWYWRNDGSELVTVRLRVSGFYRLQGES